MAKKKTLVLGTSVPALALVAGLGFAGVASAANTSGTATDTNTSTTQSTSSERWWDGENHGDHGNQRAGGRDIASALAQKLGVDEAKVKDALDTFRKANKPTERPADGTKLDRTAMEAVLAKSLAGSLGVDESKVTTALEELRTAAKTERAAGLKSKLDAAIVDEKLTQAEVDAATKAFETGAIGGES